MELTEAERRSIKAVLEGTNRHRRRVMRPMIDRAAQLGNLQLIKFLVEACQSQLEIATMYAAAMGGSLETVKWLRAKGCEWDTYVFADALICNHFELVKWLGMNGCPWNKKAPYILTYNEEQLKIIEWLEEHGK